MASFRLNSEDNEFNSRVDALLSSLQTAAATVDLNPQNPQPNEEDEDDVNACDNKEDGFRKPTVRPHRWRGGGRGGGNGARNAAPDYVMNPRKWTRYNMKDTPVLNDRENKQEGLRLFDKLRSRRLEGEAEAEEEVGEASEALCPKITFKKPTKVEDTEKREAEEEESPDMSADALFGGTKRVRKEEYVVGVSKKKKHKKSTEADGSRKEEKKSDSVKLGYLMFEDEEEDE